jgi:hypothetical protein
VRERYRDGRANRDWREAACDGGKRFEVALASTTLHGDGFIPPGALVEVELDAWAAE